MYSYQSKATKIMKNQGALKLLKEQNKSLIIKPKEMEICELPEKKNYLKEDQ